MVKPRTNASKYNEKCIINLIVFCVERLLISGGWDGVVRVWGNIGKSGQALRGLKAEFDHEGKVTSVTHR